MQKLFVYLVTMLEYINSNENMKYSVLLKFTLKTLIKCWLENQIKIS